MINLTRLNRADFVLNSDLIEYIEQTPETVVSLTNGVKLRVLESPGEIVDRVIIFRRRVIHVPEQSAGRALRVGAEYAAGPAFSTETTPTGNKD